MFQQEEFDRKYITSSEVCERVGIVRTTIIFAVRDGRFPEPIRLRNGGGSTHIMLWERASVEGLVEYWRVERTLKKAAQA